MAYVESSRVKKTPISVAQSGQMAAVAGQVAVTTSLAANDVLGLVVLPAEHEIVDFILDTTDLDSNATKTIKLDVGVVNADKNNLVTDSELITESTVAQAGGVARSDTIKGLRLAASNANRTVGVKVATVAATKKAGTVRGTLIYRPV